jgi:small subunit ribosomal protein S5
VADKPERNREEGAGAGAGAGAGSGGGGGGRFAGRTGRGQRRGPRSGGDDTAFFEKPAEELSEKVVFINRSAKVVKGGRRFSFSALVVAGDRRGRVGIGLGKGTEVADAIRKGGEVARRNMEKVSVLELTIPHEVYSTFCGAKILLRPASPGTGVIAGKTVRAVLDAAGVKNVLSKSLGSKNPANVVKATVGALRQLRQREEIYKNRGLPMRSPESQAAA